MIEYAELDGVVLHNLAIMSQVMIRDVDGITGIPTVRGETYQRAENDGEVEPANQYLGARISAWEIAVWGTSIADARANWTTINRTLLKAVRSQKLLKWRALGDTLNLQSSVRVASVTPPKLSPSTQGPYYLCQVLFRHADPVNYDVNTSVVATGAPSVIITGMPIPIPFPIPWSLVGSGSGTVAVTNAGDAPAWPVIDIAGPINAPSVRNGTTGKALYFDGLNLAAGETLTIDMNPATRSARVGGVSKFSALRFADSEFFSISPGATENITLSGTGTSGSTTMTVTLRSAYIT